MGCPEPHTCLRFAKEVSFEQILEGGRAAVKEMGGLRAQVLRFLPVLE